MASELKMAAETQPDRGIYMEGMDGRVYRAFPEGWREVLDPIERIDAAKKIGARGWCDKGHHWVPLETLATCGPRFYEFDACGDCRGEGD